MEDEMTAKRVLVGVAVALVASVTAVAPSTAQIVVAPPPPVVVVPAPPSLVVVPGTPVYYAPALPYNYFVYHGQYYVFHEGAWFRAKGHGGPWVFVAPHAVPRPVLAVPVAYYKVPPGHLKKGGPPHGGGHGKGPKWKGD
jgi:hypothetical protein